MHRRLGLPRISGLFNDLNPDPGIGGGGTISWRELSDRVAITYQNVPQFANSDSNNFQIEMFFDGQIAITHLALGVIDGIVGLSQGLGLPLEFGRDRVCLVGRNLQPGP